MRPMCNKKAGGPDRVRQTLRQRGVTAPSSYKCSLCDFNRLRSLMYYPVYIISRVKLRLLRCTKKQQNKNIENICASELRGCFVASL